LPFVFSISQTDATSDRLWTDLRDSFVWSPPLPNPCSGMLASPSPGRDTVSRFHPASSHLLDYVPAFYCPRPPKRGASPPPARLFLRRYFPSPRRNSMNGSLSVHKVFRNFLNSPARPPILNLFPNSFFLSFPVFLPRAQEHRFSRPSLFLHLPHEQFGPFFVAFCPRPPSGISVVQVRSASRPGKCSPEFRFLSPQPDPSPPVVEVVVLPPPFRLERPLVHIPIIALAPSGDGTNSTKSLQPARTEILCREFANGKLK